MFLPNNFNWSDLPALLLKSVHFKKTVALKIMIIFDNTPADFVLMSADVLLEMIIILSELRIAQLSP